VFLSVENNTYVKLKYILIAFVSLNQSWLKKKKIIFTEIQKNQHDMHLLPLL